MGATELKKQKEVKTRDEAILFEDKKKEDDDEERIVITES